MARSGDGFPDTFRGTEQAYGRWQVRHLGVSNFDLTRLQQARGVSETPLLTDQVPYSLTDRSYARERRSRPLPGPRHPSDRVFSVDEGRLKPGKVLASIADAHGVSPYQIALAWLVSQPRDYDSDVAGSRASTAEPGVS